MSERRVQVPSDEQIKQMVGRFLGWPLPENFNPDGGIRFEDYYGHRPTGTNLLDAQQAEDMIRFLFAPAEPEEPCVCDLLWKSNPFPNTGAQNRHDSAVREAFRRGQQSMIKKEKQP